MTEYKPYLCFICSKGEFDRYHPAKMGICKKYGVVKAKRDCKMFSEVS